METIEKRVEYVYNEKDLASLMQEFLTEAEQFINNNEYQLSGDFKESFDKLKKVKWTEHFGNTSKNQRKKFNKAVIRFRKKKSLMTLNRAFHLIHTRILSEREEVSEGKYYSWTWIKWNEPKDITKVKVLPPAKHLSIQEKRKKWKEAQAVANKHLKEYKTEKGDYYKSRL